MSSTTSGFVHVREQDAQASANVDYTDLVNEVRATFKSGKTKSLQWRKDQLNAVLRMIKENHEKFGAALRKDHGGSKVRGVIDLAGAVADVEIFLAHLDEWAAPMSVTHDSLLGKSYVRREPKGVVLIIAPWNFPFAMVLDPLVAVIATGNCAVIKPSEIAVHSCALMAELFPQYLDTSAIRVVTGAVPETTALLKQKFDHIMYTGNGAVGRIVMAAAAKNLTPVTLELGGKSPTFVDKSAKLPLAAERIVTAKFLNAGQICVAPDFILVHKDVADEFKKLMVDVVKKHFGKTEEERCKNDRYGKIIHPRHVDRIKSLVSDKSKVLIGGECNLDSRYFGPTIVDEPSMGDAILKEEIFGPLLPIVTVSDAMDAAKKAMSICDTPLALYVFAEDQKVIDTFIENTTSGGVCVNAAVDQLSNHSLPFGGVGESGMGKYHGKWGFEEFSHHRGVLVRDTMVNKMAMLPPPAEQTDGLYDFLVKFMVTGFLSGEQKMALKAGSMAAAAFVGYKVLKANL